MAEDYGTGVSRTLSAFQRQFSAVVFQRDNPPLDSEINLMSQVQLDRIATAIRSTMPSGFFTDPTRALDEFQTQTNWSNFFVLGDPRGDSPNHDLDSDELDPVIWANVNGWIVPVAGTDISTADGVQNLVKLFPAPVSDARTDFVFLEVWQTLVAPNPSADNKPSVSTLWKHGNVKFGGTNLTDDLEDPLIGFETTERVQIQYRIRVFGEGLGLGAGVALDVYPDGLDDPNILGQGTATSPVGGFTFDNMREALGDPSLWRAGDGDSSNALGTIDGFVYAIPIVAIFRRNSGGYVAISDGGNANQNGSFNRTPGTILLPDPLDGARALTSATLTNDLLFDTEGDIDITGLNGSGWEDPHVLSSTFLVIEDEIIGISAADTVGGTLTVAAGGRGRFATHATAHLAGTEVFFFNARTDGLYADEIAAEDILDLRRSVNPGDWDYQRLLEHNLGALVRNELTTAWKQSSPGDTEGPVVQEVDYLLADGGTATPNQTESLDGPDGIRTIWSDAAVIQKDVTLLLDNDAVLIDNGIGFVGANSFDATTTWDVGPNFLPIGFMNNQGGAGDFPATSWPNGSSIIFHIGGESGTAGARSTFRDTGTRAVRFVSPREWLRTSSSTSDPTNGNQHPVTIRFIDQWSQEPGPPVVGGPLIGADFSILHPGPMYPWPEQNFERPFIVLGGILANSLRITGVPATDLSQPTTDVFEIDLGVNFDSGGVFFSKDAASNFINDPSLVTIPLLRGERTLFSMLTDDGRDRTGNSTEVYVLTYGDKDSTQNNGAFRVVGAGTATSGYTHQLATNSTSIVVEALSVDFSDFDAGTGNSITVEFRSPFTNSEDGGARTGFTGDLAIALTDIGGETEHPWNKDALFEPDATPPIVYDNRVPFFPNDPPVNDNDAAAITSKLLVSLTLLYHPGRSAMARVPDTVIRGALRNNSTTYLRRSPHTVDPTFAGVPVPTPVETYYDPVHVQTWNRLPGLGWHAPTAPNYGGNVVGFTEQDREHELFFDKGSKTAIFRPFRTREMTIRALSYPQLTGGLFGNIFFDPTGTPFAKDNLQLWTQGNTGTYSVKPANPVFTGSGQQMGFIVPREFMPRFGRQDIPFYDDQDAGTGPFLAGINHLFVDVADVTSPVFEIIGGEDNTTSGNLVTIMLVRTSNPPDYGHAIAGANITASVVTDFYEGRKTTEINAAVTFAPDIIAALAAVNSSDLGKGLRGIQLPPYVGPARVIGVYTAADFESKGGRTVLPDRFTPEVDSAPNLLRTDADQQTLFILQDGAKDLTQESDDHTYIIPEEALDVSRAIGFSPGGLDDFDDFDYVVAVTLFGFAKGFINENNFAMVRSHDGQGNTNLDGEDPELEGVKMCIPTAAGLNEHLFFTQNRTVYQGDPFMTRDGGSRTTSDYESRYGQIGVASRFAVATPLEQFDSSGNFVIETPNPRSFEVLASLDFYTTLGTGKIGGDLPPGTLLDVGRTEDTEDTADRFPLAIDSNPWRVLTRAFTEGQRNKNESRSQLIVELLDHAKLSTGGTLFATTPIFATMEFNLLDDREVQIVFTTALNQADTPAFTITFSDPDSRFFVGSFDAAPNTEAVLIAVDQRHKADTQFISGPRAFGTFVPGETKTLTLAGASDSTIADNAVLSVSMLEDPVSNAFGAIVFDVTRISDGPPGQVGVRGTYTLSPEGFEALTGGNTVQHLTSGALSVPANSIHLEAVTFTGAAVGDAVVVSANHVSAGLIIESATVTAPNTVTVQIQNVTGSAIAPGVAITLDIGLLQDPSNKDLVVSGGRTFNVSITQPNVGLTALQPQSVGDLEETAKRVIDAVPFMPRFSQAVSARNVGSNIIFTSEAVGAEANDLRVRMFYFDTPDVGIEEALRFHVPSANDKPATAIVTDTDFFGAIDLPVNAGNGTSQLRLTGMTERLPMGILLSDHEFLCENPLNDTASAMQTTPAGIRPVNTLIPLTGGGEEHRRFLGVPGDLLAMSDGSIGVFSSGGTTSFRLYRGGGSAFVLSGENPGGPIDWVSETFPPSVRPVLKGGALVCRALLVRNFYEEAFTSPSTTSQGDEIQMIIITHGVFGNGETQKDGVELSGIISPTGYGEGYAAADRYRIDGRPMFSGFNRSTTDPDTVTLAPFPETSRIEE